MKHEWNLILAVCFQLKQLKKQPEKNSKIQKFFQFGPNLHTTERVICFRPETITPREVTHKGKNHNASHWLLD